MKRLRSLGLPLLLPQSTSLVLLLFVLTLTTVLQAWPTNFFRGSRIGYGRHIRPIHCVDKTKRTGGICMFAWDCMKANGTHLGTCIDRFYFGSCCKMEPSSYPHPFPNPVEEEDITPVEDPVEEEIYADNAQTVSESLSDLQPGFVLLDNSVSSNHPDKTGQTVISDTDITIPLPGVGAEYGITFIEPEVESDVSSHTFSSKVNKTDSDSATFQESDSESVDDLKTIPIPDSQKTTTPSLDTSKIPSLSDDHVKSDVKEVASEGGGLDDMSKPGFPSEGGYETKPSSDSSLHEEPNLENDSHVVPAPEEETESMQTLNDTVIASAPETDDKPDSVMQDSTQSSIQDMNNIFTGESNIPSKINTARPLIVQDRHPTTFRPELTTIDNIAEATTDIDYLLIPESEFESEMQENPETEPPTEMSSQSKPALDVSTESALESEVDSEQTTDSTSVDMDPSQIIEETTLQFKPEEGGFKPFGLENIEPEISTSEVQEEPEHHKDVNESSKTPIGTENVFLEDGEKHKIVTTFPLPQDDILDGGDSTSSLYSTTESIFETEEISTFGFEEIHFPDVVLPTGVVEETSVNENTKPDSQFESTTTLPDTLAEVDTSNMTPSEDFTPRPLDQTDEFETSTIDTLETSEAEKVTSSIIESDLVTTMKPGSDFSPMDDSTSEIVTKPTTSNHEESTQAISSTEEKTEIPNSWDEVIIIDHTNAASSPPTSTEVSSSASTSTEISSSSSYASSASPVEGELESSTLAAPANMSTTSIESMSPSEQEKLLVEMLKIANYKDICGKPVYPISRIVGGLEASYGEWPWQVSLRQWRSVAFLHKCGSALVNENWAITAAHCVEGIEPDQLLLVMGEYDLGTTKEPYGHVERSVQVIAMHPKFEPRTFEYDLALLRFSEPVTFQPNIIPICIPEDDYNFLNNTGFVTGWGRLYEDGPLPTVMQKVPVPVIPNSDCEEMYKEAGYIEHIPNIFICAGYQGGKQDSCEGDSGGPMVINYKHRWRLAGIISWGIGCAVPNQPGVYTRISEFREWINKIIRF